MFSRALFKQSSKANGIMWSIITFFECFMLACVMLISGGGTIGQMKTSISDAIITGEIDAELNKRAINYYETTKGGLIFFDNTYTTYFKNFENDKNELTQYDQEIVNWIDSGCNESTVPVPTSEIKGFHLKNVNDWLKEKPDRNNFETDEAYSKAMETWNSKNPTSKNPLFAFMMPYYVQNGYLALSINKLQDEVFEKLKAKNPEITKESNEYLEIVGTILFSINPNEMFDDEYLAHNEKVPEFYDVKGLVENVNNDKYLTSSERINYVMDRAGNTSTIFLASNMSKAENVNLLVEQLSKFGVTYEKFLTYGYDYSGIKHSSNTTILTYQTRYDYEKSLIETKKANGEFATDEEYRLALVQMDKNLKGDLSNSLLNSLPKDVSNGLEEIGQMDMYSLVVGSIFFKMSGLLLPIIFMIMASNNLIAGQVDSGSMAYVLSTSTKRNQVTFTQSIYMILSLFAMFSCTTITSVICLSVVDPAVVGISYGEIILLNLGAFITLFAMSGICFLTSCWFDRSKRAMAIGGGLSMFFLVATMLGLFGSQIIPSVIRLESLNNFNYVSLITLFDVTSIMDMTTAFIWKFAILIGIGLAGYIIGAVKFKKKDLPL